MTVASSPSPQPSSALPDSQELSSKPLARQPVPRLAPVSEYFHAVPAVIRFETTGVAGAMETGAGEADRLPRASVARTVYLVTVVGAVTASCVPPVTRPMTRSLRYTR